MDGASASAAAASSGCDYDESQPQKEIPTLVDASSAPSTSNTNPSPESSLVPSLEEECYTSGFNDDSMQGIEKQLAPFVGSKVNLSRLNVSDDDESEQPLYDIPVVASGWDDVHIDKPPLYNIPVVASEWASSSEPPLYAIPAVASEWADVYKHKHPQVKSPTMVASEYDNYSLTSNSGNASLDMNAVDDDCGPSGYNDDCGPSGYNDDCGPSGNNDDCGPSGNNDDCGPSGHNDDYMQGIEKPTSPFISEKEPLSALAAEFKSGSLIMQEKIKLLGEKYTALRRTRGDGNCFFRSFMFSYLEHILVTQDRREMERVMFEIERCRLDLVDLGYTEFTYEDYFGVFTELLENCVPGHEASLSLTDLLGKACDQMTSDCAVMFLRFATSAALQKRAEFFEPFVTGPSRKSVVQFCRSSVEPMGEESEHVHIIALCDALGVPIRVVYLDSCSTGDPVNPNAPNHHDFFPYDQENVENNGSTSTDAANVSTDLSKQENSAPQQNPVPFVTLLYRPGHYDILYPM